MKELIKAINQGEIDKCGVAVSIYREIDNSLDHLERQLEGDVKMADVQSIDQEVDRQEQLLNDLAFILTGVEAEMVVFIRKQLEADYLSNIQTLEHYNLISQDSSTYNPDYDGTDLDGSGENFQGRQFHLPTLAEVYKQLRPEHYKLYLQMLANNEEPRLQITPIGFKIATLINNFIKYTPSTQVFLSGNRPNHLQIESNLPDSEIDFVYEPKIVSTDKNGEVLRVHQTSTKTDWINQNNGYLLDIISTRPREPEVKRVQGQSRLKVAVNVFRDYLDSGFLPLSIEAGILAQMNEVQRSGYFLEGTESMTNLLMGTVLLKHASGYGPIPIVGGNRHYCIFGGLNNERIRGPLIMSHSIRINHGS